jgi:hypothetical protein
MPLIEAALAFAITMLALSLIVSSFVEIIHRAFKMREAGLKFMLEQLFDQVLVKYVEPMEQAASAKLAQARDDRKKAIEEQAKALAAKDEKAKKIADKAVAAAEQIIAESGKIVEDAYKTFRDRFVERMTANRSPVGLKPDTTLAIAGKPAASKPRLRLGNIWGGRRVTALTPTDFMERLGSNEVGDAIRDTIGKAPAAAVNAVFTKVADIDVDAELQKAVNAGTTEAVAAANILREITQKLGSIDVSQEIGKIAATSGTVVADKLDTVLTDVAQKFDGFGKDAASYFEGRARMMSVAVAIVLAFAAHVDAIDLFRTYLRDPNARAKVIEQSQAVTAQYKAAKEAADALKQIAPKDNAGDAGKPAGPVANPADAGKEPDPKAQVEQLRKDWQAAIGNVDATVKQYADLGIPLGWNDARWANLKMSPLFWTCTQLESGDKEWLLGTLWKTCKADEVDTGMDPKAKPQDAQNQKPPEKTYTKYRTVWLGWLMVPTALDAVLYLILGGLLIGLGSPFWYDAVTALTSIRGAAKGATSPAAPAQAAATAPADKSQPATPVGAFKVSNDARA